jgi:DNA-binding transcriptional ArsR family regulator
MDAGPKENNVARYADMFAAIGAEPRLRIVRALLAAHPQGMIVGDIQSELAIPASTLSHHLDKLKNENLVNVRRDRQFLWYTANTAAVEELLGFLYAECCSRNQVVAVESIVPASQIKGAVKAKV